MKNTDTVRLSPEMREVLQLDDAEPIAGNVMARAINATCGGGWAGMEYGWADEDEDALAFIVGLVESVDEDHDHDPDDWSDVADSAVPIYTSEVWAVGSRFRGLLDESEAQAFADPERGVEGILSAGLFLLADLILTQLATQLAEVIAEEDEDEDEDDD